jgi:glycosyltransferase involved in cell wall biosynthesis
MVGGLRQLSEANNELELLYFSNRYSRESAGASQAGLQESELFQGRRIPSRLAWMQLGLPDSLKQAKPDLCHFPNYLAPILRPIDSPFVATMYDMSVYRCPEFHPLKTVQVHRAIMPQVIRQSRLIITVSESAKRDILDYFDIPAEKIKVVYGGVSTQFSEPGARDMTLVQRYKLNFPFVLMVGTLEPRKNHARLISAFSRLIQQERLPHHLVLIGPRGWKEGSLKTLAQQGQLSERIHFLGYIPENDLAGLYRAADAFVFPSLHEGFGLPVLEALASGVPTLISNDPALLELAGQEAALAVDPCSIEDLAGGLYQILSDNALAKRLRQAGINRARQFSWEKCAAETLAVYQEALVNPPPEFFVPKAHYTPAADSAAPILDKKHSPLELPKTYTQNINRNLIPTPLEQAIMKTIVYADVFAFPLTVVELHRYLIGYYAHQNQLQTCLEQSDYLANYLQKQSGYISLRGRQTSGVERQHKLLSTRRHWETATFWGKVLQNIPFLRAGLVTGGLAANNSGSGDDIDLLLITQAGRLWLCRAMVIGVVYLARLVGVELCPNYLLADNNEALTLTEQNLYTAREFANMRLIFGRDSYRRLLELNQWVEELLPNASQHLETQEPTLTKDRPGEFGKLLKGFGEWLLGGKLGDKLEKWEQKRKIARLQKPEALETRFTADICKGHYTGYGQETLKAFATRCTVLEIPVAIL